MFIVFRAIILIDLSMKDRTSAVPVSGPFRKIGLQSLHIPIEVSNHRLLVRYSLNFGETRRLGTRNVRTVCLGRAY